MDLDREIVVEALPAYEVGEELGRGAWGIVLAGTHRRLGREVAIKQLPRTFGADPGVRARFLSEAKLLASFDHPHIVPIYDFVEHDGVCLLVMARLTGGTVWEQFVGPGFTQDTACAVVLAACAGLHYAHQRGVLHRDVKPENMMFSRDGALKVTDFGIAKVVGGTQTMATRTGSVLGTPAYLAPEQAESKPLTPATDVYATGTVLFELLSGELPFADTDNALAALYQRVHTEPRSLRDTPADVPGGLISVTEKAIARDPSRRYRDADEFGRDLAEACTSTWGPAWLAESGVSVRGAEGMLPGVQPPKPRPARPRPAKAAEPPVARTASRPPPVGASDLAPDDLVPVRPPSNESGSGAPVSAPRGGLPRWAIAAGLVAIAALVTTAMLVGGGPDSEPDSDVAGPPTAADGPAAGGDSPTSTESEQIVRGYLDAYNRNDLETAATFFAPHANILGTRVAGPAAVAADLSAYGCKEEPTSLIAEGETVTTVNKLSDLPNESCGKFDGTTNTIVYTIRDGAITRMTYG